MAVAVAGGGESSADGPRPGTPVERDGERPQPDPTKSLPPPDGGADADEQSPSVIDLSPWRSSAGGSPAIAATGHSGVGTDGNFSLIWQAPSTRQNGQPLQPEEIQYYLLVLFAVSELPATEAWLAQRIPSGSRFDAAGQQFAPFISAADVEELLVTGYERIYIVQPHQIPVRVRGASPDHYYFAVATVDWLGQISALSNTVRVDVPP